ncbi:MAG: hypothetical protein U0941_07110 [Planctomycetaceae bacterium]
MLRPYVGLILLLAVTCGGLSGCTSGFGFDRAKFAKGEQWEPDVEEEPASTPPKDWRNGASNLRSPNARKSNEDPIDKLLWSDEARDINRSLGGSL